METTRGRGSLSWLSSPPPSPEGELMETNGKSFCLFCFCSYPPPSPEGELMETMQHVPSAVAEEIETPRLRLKEN